MEKSDTPLFSQLGFSRELYDIRQKNGLYLLGAAWFLEVVAALIGLLIAIILILQGQESLRSNNIEITTSMQYSVYISGLPFIMSAVVELMKIPIVTLVYHSQSLVWKSIFIFALFSLAFITFETMSAGMQQGYQVRTGGIQELTQSLGRANQERDSLLADIEESTSIDTSELDERRIALERELTEARLRIRGDAQSAIDGIRQRLGEGSTGTAQAGLDRLRTQREGLTQDQSDELEQVSTQYDSTVERIEALRASSLQEMRTQGSQVQDIYQTEVENCQGLFTTGSCQDDAEDRLEASLVALETSRQESLSLYQTSLQDADDVRSERDAGIRASYAQQFNDLDQRIENASRVLNETRNVDVARFEAMIQEVEDSRDFQIAEITGRLEAQIAAITEQVNLISAPADLERLASVQTRITELDSIISRDGESLDRESATNQIYQIAKLAMSVCLFISDEDCLANNGNNDLRYSDLPQDYVEKISIYWFGSLALIMSTIGIMLAFGAMVLKYEHIDEHSAFKRGLKAFGRNLSMLWSEIISAIRYLFSLFIYIARILKSIRKYFVYRAKYFAKEPLIKEKIVEKPIEVPVEKVITKEVIKEVPVEKVVIKTVEKPIPMKSKEFVYVPFYSDDPKEREAFEEKMNSLDLNNPLSGVESEN